MNALESVKARGKLLEASLRAQRDAFHDRYEAGAVTELDNPFMDERFDPDDIITDYAKIRGE